MHQIPEPSRSSFSWSDGEPELQKTAHVFCQSLIFCVLSSFSAISGLARRCSTWETYEQESCRPKVQRYLQKIGEVFCARACTGIIPDVTCKRNLFAALSPVQQHCTGSRTALCKHREIECLLTNFHRMLKVACNIYCEWNCLRVQQNCWMSSVSTHSWGPLRAWLVNCRPPLKHQASAEKKAYFLIIILHPALEQAADNNRSPPESEKDWKSPLRALIPTIPPTLTGPHSPMPPSAHPPALITSPARQTQAQNRYSCIHSWSTDSKI